jgi:hypothetical protein
MRVVWPWTSWGCFPGCCASVFFFNSYNSWHYIYKSPNKMCRSLGFSQDICTHTSIKRFVKDALLQVYVRSEVLQWPHSPRWVTLHSTALLVGPSSFPAHATSVIWQTAESRSRVVITPYLWGPGFKSHPKARLTRVLVVFPVPPGKCRLSHDRFLPHSSVFFTIILSFDAV